MKGESVMVSNRFNVPGASVGARVMLKVYEQLPDLDITSSVQFTIEQAINDECETLATEVTALRLRIEQLEKKKD